MVVLQLTVIQEVDEGGIHIIHAIEQILVGG